MEGEVIAARTMNSLYIWLGYCLSYDVTGRVAMDQAQTSCDCGTHRGALYFAVDYGMFYLLLEHGKKLEQIRFGFCYGFPSVTDLQISYGYGCGWTAMDIP